MAAAQADQLETIIVTGTRLPRAEAEAASATVVVSHLLLSQTGAATVERTLNELPQFVPAASAASNDPGNDGQANLSLRGLGPSQTLVLLDGRRLTPADGRGAVDVNILPPALIERVEVVTGGASAVYGSDAIAGVVNFRLKDSFDGVEIDAGWSETARGDGEEYSLGLTAGSPFAGGRGHVTAHLGYSSRARITQSERGFSRYPLEYFADGAEAEGTFVPTGSAFVEEGIAIVFASPATFHSLFEAYGLPRGTVPYTAGLGVNADGTVFTIGTGAPGSVANYRGDRQSVLFNDRVFGVYDVGPFTALQMPLERTSVFSLVEFDLTDQTDGYVQVLVADYSVTQQLAPIGAGIALVPPTNPHIPPDLATLLASRVNPDAPFRYFKRLSELGPRRAGHDRDVQQVTAGVRGALTDSWTYDVYAQLGRNDRDERQTNHVLLSRLQDLTFAADGGAAICGDFDPFAARSLTPDCVRYVAIDAANSVTVEQTLFEGSVSGPLLTVPAGRVRGVLGMLHKRDRFRFEADPILSAQLPPVPGVIGGRPDLGGVDFQAAVDRGGEERNTDLYLELLIPLLRTASAQRVDLGLGYRHSGYDRAGGVDSYKGELTFQPNTRWRLRGSYQRTVRAPSVEELFYPAVASQFIINPPDPCSASSAARTGPNSAAVTALCLAQGVPAVLLPAFEYPLRRVDGVAGGNPDLAPERADTYTFGVVFAPKSGGPLPGELRASLDWYRIDLRDGIGRWPMDSAVDRCFDPTFNPGLSSANVYCSFFERRPDTGELLARVIDRNIGGVRTSGLDLQVGWQVGAGPGMVTVTENVAYVTEWLFREPGGSTLDHAGTIGGQALGRSLPRWKSLLHLDWRWRAVSVFAKWQHVAAQRDVEFRQFRVPARNYLSLGAGYQFDTVGLEARLGIENLLDEAAPVFPSWQQANTDPSQYDVLGRRYYASLTYRPAL